MHRRCVFKIASVDRATKPRPGFLESLKAKLEQRPPEVPNERPAAVAVIFSPQGDSVLLIERARRDGDPWSGQIAFPGGKMQAGDADLRSVAMRETREEVGVSLESEAVFWGYLRSFRTHTGNMDVVPSVFVLRRPVEPVPNGEVASFKWVRLAALREGSGASRGVGAPGSGAQVPATVADGYTVWGLTYRILTELFDAGGWPAPSASLPSAPS